MIKLITAILVTTFSISAAAADLTILNSGSKTGGFSMHETSFAFYKSPAIEVVAIIFMILGSCNFALHFYFLSSRKLSKNHFMIFFSQA